MGSLRYFKTVHSDRERRPTVTLFCSYCFRFLFKNQNYEYFQVQQSAEQDSTANAPESGGGAWGGVQKDNF